MNPSTSQGSYRRQKAKSSVAPKLPLHRSSEALSVDEPVVGGVIRDRQPPHQHPHAHKQQLSEMMTSATTDMDGTGMGFRQDTSMVPLRGGEVRIPFERPPMIFGRWASVTQTGEMFPSTTAEAFPPLTSPPPLVTTATTTAPNTQAAAAVLADAVDDETIDDGLDEMEKHVSNMLLDDDDCLEDDDTQLSVQSPNSVDPQSKLPIVSGLGTITTSTRPRRVPQGLILISNLTSASGANGSSTMLKRISDHFPRYLFPPPPPPAADLSCYDNITSSYSPLMRKKMMRWYQIVELWCIERTTAPSSVSDQHQGLGEVTGQSSDGGMLDPTCLKTPEQHLTTLAESTTEPAKFREVADNERAIVAPPPRPPMFSEHVAPQLEMVKWNATQLWQHTRAPYSVDQWINICRRWWVMVMNTFDRLRDETRYEGFQHVSKGAVGRVWTAADVSLMVA
ncbi:Hypothetical protein, putative [Bodo saltans]|uniref:Uncharacterized protein n=1 Tax=Bodo saltans TaxID=75058 RepID=A0A0S4JNQ9_BODSA|nr:Hypothetical protein, putative [Bodo saltans]|eukprot:CUG91895.1 Hypothetical protein, putative [Bodo saltans]